VGRGNFYMVKSWCFLERSRTKKLCGDQNNVRSQIFLFRASSYDVRSRMNETNEY